MSTNTYSTSLELTGVYQDSTARIVERRAVSGFNLIFWSPRLCHKVKVTKQETLGSQAPLWPLNQLTWCECIVTRTVAPRGV